MKYRESQQDKSLRNRFDGDYSHALLRRIRLEEGAIRSITALDLTFKYPITAIAGRNGAGKSTILALACCAYHNAKSAFRLPRRKYPYYTFSDFFVQHAEEVPPEGVEIRYYIAHNKWKPTSQMPKGVGLAFQRRRKKKGGRWNDYAERIKKNVVFLGIERIVPHIERSQSRSYSRVFTDAQPKGWENKVKEAVGDVLGRKYDEFRYLEYSKYSLPIVKVGDVIYSGFNMGAGENALFEIFSTIYSAGPGSLLVIDEVELGLHAEAQKKFVSKLKQVCLETGTQIICTTHSKEIFDCLPYDARFFVETIQGKTRVTEGISSEFAFSKLASQPSKELEILVEDEVARTILQTALPAELRYRVSIIVIGSASALARQLAAIKVREGGETVLAVFDGDQKVLRSDNLSYARTMCESAGAEFDLWFEKHTAYLPGETWPEAWLVQRAVECAETLADEVMCGRDDLKEFLEYGLQSGKHNEFHELAKHLGLERGLCLQTVSLAVTKECGGCFEELVIKIHDLLGEAG